MEGVTIKAQIFGWAHTRKITVVFEQYDRISIIKLGSKIGVG